MADTTESLVLSKSNAKEGKNLSVSYLRAMELVSN